MDDTEWKTFMDAAQEAAAAAFPPNTEFFLLALKPEGGAVCALGTMEPSNAIVAMQVISDAMKRNTEEIPDLEGDVHHDKTD